MNIPEFTNEMRQVQRSESVVSAPTEERSQASSSPDRVAIDAVQKSDDAKNQKQSLSRGKLNELVAEAQEQLEKSDVSLKFNVIEENDTVQVEIVDSDGKTIRKIPEDDLLKLSKSLKNLDRGFLDKMS